MKAKKLIGNLLLAFLLVSVGYAIGRETAPVGEDVEQELLCGSSKRPGDDQQAATQPQAQDAAVATSNPRPVADQPDDSPATTPVPIAAEEKIIVYYMHGPSCITCKMIDSAAAAVVADDFADEVKSGKMVYASLNYSERKNWPLADKYSVSGNVVIVVRFLDGKEVQRVRLDNVMRLATEAPADLSDYIREGIATVLQGGGQ